MAWNVSSDKFVLTGNQGRDLVVEWRIKSQDRLNAITTIEYTVRGGGTASGYVYSGPIQVYINNTPVYQTSSRIELRGQNSYGGATILKTGTFNVSHNSVGDGQFTIRAAAYIYYMEEAGQSYQSTGSETFILDSIPRASGVSANSGNIGSSVLISIAKTNTIFTHTLAFSFGNASGTIAARTDAATVSWTPPMELCNQIPNANSGSCTIICDTYYGSLKVGTTTAEITLAVPASVKPSVPAGWASVTYSNASTAAASISEFVQGYSRAAASFDGSKVSVAGCYGATVSEYYMEIGGKKYHAPYLSDVLTASGNVKATCFVEDSRGRTASEEVEFTVNSYARPSIGVVTAFRCNQQGEEDSSGTWINASAASSISSINGANSASITARIKRVGGSVIGQATLQDGIPSVFGGGAVLTMYVYDVEVFATDSLGNSSGTVTVRIPTEAWGVWVSDDLDCAGICTIPQSTHVLELPAGWSIKIGDTVLSAENIEHLLELL